MKQLQCWLAAGPVVRNRSLTMHCPQLVGWCYVGYLYSDWHMRGDSALFLAVECTKLVNLIRLWSKYVSNHALGIYALRLPRSAQESKSRRSLGLDCGVSNTEYLVHSMPMNRLSACSEFCGVHSWQNGTRCRDGVKVLWCHWSPSSLVGFWGFHPYMRLFSFRKRFVTCTRAVGEKMFWLWD